MVVKSWEVVEHGAKLFPCHEPNRVYWRHRSCQRL